MGDALDDLFGAFDSVATSAPAPSNPASRSTDDSIHPANKKFKYDDDGSVAVETTAPLSTSAIETKENQVSGHEDVPTSSMKVSFTTVMNHSSLSSVHQTQQKDKSDGKGVATTTITSTTIPLQTGTTSTIATTNNNTATSNSAVPVVDREIATGTSHDKSVRSYTAYPKNLPAGHIPTNIIPPSEPAKIYNFTLDPFQQQSISYIDKEQSVLVAAHTSAGKTAVAEYAIAKSLKNNQRVIYTSPIKALSNQKFRDLQEEFVNVGLMTGDITINPDATILVMTTEILRSMLYRGSEIIREVAWIVYDEVHYMRDSERGVVWEESIILLPHKVKFVFLSATIPNASQFADWIAEIHHQPCHVVYTNYRPTPLQHYVFPQNGDGLHLVVDEKGKFREANFQKAMATLQSGNVDVATAEAMLNSGNGKKRGRKGNSTGPDGKKKNGPFADLHRIVKLIMARNLDPVIIFSFSKKDCEKYALALNQEDFTDDVEKDLITQVYTNAIESLSEDDRKLPQVEALLPLLKRGIGIHHGGLLPILKEIVEILFSEGLIKTLFATETFSIGINMPAKTVVFTNTRKWDGKDFRWVTSGEYIQMSGRAGRRGKDDRGIVIQMLDEKMEPAVCKDILYGAPDPLNSSYKISYNMLLNLMRVEDVDPEYLLRASFHQFQREQAAPALIAKAEDLELEADAIDIGTPDVAELVSQYFMMDQQLVVTQNKITKILQKPEYILKFLQPGRLVNIKNEEESFGWGVLVTYKKKQGRGSAGEAGRLASLSGGSDYVLDVILACVERSATSGEAKEKVKDNDDTALSWIGTTRSHRPAQIEDDRKNILWRIFTVGLEDIQKISAVKLALPQDYTTLESRTRVGYLMGAAMIQFSDGLPLLDPIADLGIKDDDFVTLMKRATVLTERLESHKLATDHSEDDRRLLVQSFQKRFEKLEQARLLREEARACQTISMKEDLKKMKRVLKKLGHVDAMGVIQTKGRTACEVNTADELVVVELIFAGIFNDLSVEQSAALLSCLTFDERNKDDGDPASGLKAYLSTPFYKLQEIARNVAKVKISCGIELNEEEYVDKFNPGMMEAVYAWCKGVKFIQVQELTGSFEGTTIRTLRRLEELVRQIAVAAKAIGNVDLQEKFEKGSELIKRDIVFCSSLYL